ncbi:MAG: translocation/assembly module TamB domain-containing protein [Spirochaetes bacterium]|nr:translocation/assembly module TamB domain-containing protein [Spirochaetota bacterium]
MKRALRFTLGFLAIGALVGATVAGVSALDRALTVRMAELKVRGMAALEQLIGRRVAYGSISPSVLWQIVVRDLVVHSSDGAGSDLLTVRTLKVRYSLLGLLSGRDPVGSLREIRISGVTLRLDLTADRDLLDLVSRFTSSDGWSAGLPRLRLVGAGVDVELAMPGARVTGTGLFFEAGGSGKRLDVALRGSLSGRMETGLWFQSGIKARGTVSRDFTAADAIVRLLTLETPVASVRPQTLQASWADGRLAVTKIEDRVPVDLTVVVGFPSGDVTATMRAEGFRADQLVQPTGHLARFAPWLAAPVSGTASVTWRPADGSLFYAGDLAVDLVDQLPVAPDVYVAAVFDGDRHRVRFSSLTAASPSGSLEFIGDVLLSNLWPEGILTVSNLTSLAAGSADATVTVKRLTGSLSVDGSQVQLGQVRLDRLRADIEPGPTGLKFDATASFADAPEGDLVHAAGELVTVAPRHLSLSANLAGAPPDQLYYLVLGAGGISWQEAQIRDLLSRISVDATVALWTDFDRLVVTSPQLTVSSRADPHMRLSTVFTMDRSNVYLSGFTGTWGGLTVAGDASVKIADDGSARFGANVRFKDIPYSLTGSWSARDGLFVEGSYGLSVALVTTSGGAATLRARAEHLPVPTTGRVWYPTFDAAGEVDRSGDWKVAGRLTVPDLDVVRSTAATLEVAFDAAPRRITLREVRYADTVSVLEGGGAVDFRSPLDPFALNFLRALDAEYTLDLKTAGTAETYSLRGTAAEGALDARIGFASSPLKRFGSFALRGGVSGTGHLSGPYGSPEVSATLSLVNGMLATDPIAVTSAVRLAGRRLEVENLSVSYLDHRMSGFSGHLDLGGGSLELAGQYQGVYFLDRVNLYATLWAALGPEAPTAADAGPLGMPLTGQLDLSSIQVAGVPFPSWGLRLRTADGCLYLDGGPGDSLHASLDDRFAWVLLAQAPLPVTGRAEGRFTGTRIEAEARVASFDLRVISSMLKTDIVTFTSGNASGRLTVAGPFNDPDFTGELQLVDGGLRFRYSPDKVGPVSTAFSFSGHEFSAGPVTVPVGSAWGTASIVFTLDHWVPTSFVLDAATARDSAIRTAATFGRVIIDGRAAGRVRVAGSERRTDVTGSMTVNEARITLGEWADVPFMPEEPPTFVSMEAVTGKRVEFFWPSESYPVVRTTAAPGGKLAITYRGDTGAYTVTGAADVHGGEIFFLDRNFVLKQGSITFKEDQRSFDPRITARAEAREWDPSSGEEVRIWLDVDDTINEFSPRFSSDPSLAEPEIFALLGAPFTEQVEGQGLLSSAVMLSSDVLTRFGLLRPFEQRVRELLGLDMFSVRTQVIQNLVAEKVLGLEGTNPLDNTSLSLGKYLGDDLFLEMLVRLQAPRGPSGLLLPGHGLTSEFELNLEWDTPFFLLEWSFLPRNPDTLFLTDNSLALKWRYTY